MTLSAWPRAERGAHRALDLLNFFLADAQTGFGPFVAVYLTTHHWTQVDIGSVLTLGTITSLVSQLPAGILIDAARNKRLAASWALCGIILAALMLAVLPDLLPVMIALVLHGVASCVITPAIAAISLQMAGPLRLGERLGRNARFASIGNGLTAAVMGAGGAYVSPRFVFLLTAALCVPAIIALWRVGPGAHPQPRTAAPMLDWTGLRRMLTDRRMLVFWVCVMLFHLSNAAMLPLAGSAVTMRAGHLASLIIAACIMVPQAIVALLSPWVGRTAETAGRRPILLLGWAALPVNGVMLALLPGAWPLVAGQAVSGVSGAVFGVALPLLASDITLGTAHFNLCIAILSLGMFVGAGISTTLAGEVADSLGIRSAFLMLAAIGALGFLVVWCLMRETRPAANSPVGA